MKTHFLCPTKTFFWSLNNALSKANKKSTSFWLALFGFVIFTGQTADLLAVSEQKLKLGKEIIEIENLVSGIEGKIKNRQVEISKKSNEYTSPEIPVEGALYKNSQTVHKYTETYSSDDSTLIFDYYYDSNAKLRFVHIFWNVISGSKAEYKYYYNASFKRIWQERKILVGGWAFNNDWSDGDMVTDPQAQFQKNFE